MIRLVALMSILAGPALGDTAIAARTIPANSIIGADDIAMRDLIVPGAVEDASQIIGMETRVALFAGRPIRPGDIGLPTIVARNQLVTLIFSSGGLTITADGRALDRAGPGDVIRVMNLSSRATVTARIGIDGAAHVAY